MNDKDNPFLRDTAEIKEAFDQMTDIDQTQFIIAAKRHQGSFANPPNKPKPFVFPWSDGETAEESLENAEKWLEENKNLLLGAVVRELYERGCLNLRPGGIDCLAEIREAIEDGEEITPERLAIFAALSPEWDKWTSSELWTLDEACSLVLGIDPRPFDNAISELDEWRDSQTASGRIYRMAIEASVNKELEITEASGKLWVIPHEFVKWCRTKRIPIPERLKDLLGKNEAAKTTKERLDPNVYTVANIEYTEDGTLRFTTITDEITDGYVEIKRKKKKKEDGQFEWRDTNQALLLMDLAKAHPEGGVEIKTLLRSLYGPKCEEDGHEAEKAAKRLDNTLSTLKKKFGTNGLNKDIIPDFSRSP